MLLHKLLQLYQETKQWKEATEIIQRVADLDERAPAKAKYAYTVGVILRDELKDVEGALARFNEALDLDPTQLKPFEAINKLLTQMKDWKNLERAFRKMLHRLMAHARSRQGAAVQPVAQPRRDLSRPLEADRGGGAGVQDGQRR